MEQLNKALAQAKEGHGQIVGVMGEPGLGKSRLFHELVGAIDELVGAHSRAPLLVLQAFSVSHGKATAYLPVIELLKSYFDIQTSDDERKRREKVGGKVLMLDRSLEDTLPYLFALLGIEEQPSPLQQMGPQIRWRRTFEALKKLFLRESLNQPLVLIFEDLHWIDGETQGFLDVLSESVAGAHILLLVNYRPEYRHEWGQKTYYTQLRLAPFGKAEAEEFLDVLLGDRSSPQPSPQRGEGASPRPNGERARVRGTDNNVHALKQLILEKTQGTPFFMEEIVQELVEQGVLIRDAVGARHAVPLPTDLHIPPTVQGILAARIDRLAPDEKALLQQLAVIGREFPLSLIRQVILQPEDELYRLLAALQRKEFLYEQPAFPEVEYIFKHALTQEVAYGTVLQEQRKRLHERTGHALEALYTATLHEHYSDLAHHYRRSPNTEKAIAYLQLAGQKAGQRLAYIEAISHLTAALDLLLTQPETPERTQQELTLQIALGVPLIATESYGAPAVGQAYERARELCEQLGETLHLFPVLWGLWGFYGMRAAHRTAYALGEQFFDLARGRQDPVSLPAAHFALGGELLQLGELARAWEHFAQGIACYEPQHHRSQISLYGQDPRVCCLGYGSWALWYLGYPDQALQRCQEALTLAQKLSHPHSLAMALNFAGFLQSFRQEGRPAQDRAEAAIALSTEQGFANWLAWGIIVRGWSLAEQGQEEEGIAQMRQGLDAYRATGSELAQTCFLALLAEGCRKVGQTEEGLSVLAEALAAVDKTDERFYEAELYRIKGELTLQQSKVESGEWKVEEAEACFLKAIAIAQKQQAKSLELRAVMSLARLWQQQGKKETARQMLAEIYGWFTEGFDTKDLQEARALLEELKQVCS
ncbi:MAG: AAA family ATPase [Deltaproteobacteria bacterium]|nr:AAA family ATPase [Deltaproteobacteria bacterium]